MQEAEIKKWRRRSQDRPAELAAAAFQLFSEQGFAATRLEDVARQAGVSKATIYRYFENKEALFAAVIESAVAPRFSEAELLLTAFEGSSEDLLRTFFKVLEKGLHGPFPAMLRLVVSEAGNFPQLAQMWADLVVKRIFSLVANIIERGMARGEFRTVDAQSFVPLFGAPFFMLGLMKHAFAQTDFRLSEQEVLAAHIEMLLRGLRPDPEESTT